MAAHGTAQELAASGGTAAQLRSQGNDAFKIQEYARATELYGQALEAAGQHVDPEWLASLLTNRALAEYRLGAYEACAADAEAALAAAPGAKPALRAALARLMLWEPAKALDALAVAPPVTSSDKDAAVAGALWRCCLHRARALAWHAQLAQQAADPAADGGASMAPGESTAAEQEAVRKLEAALDALSSDMDGEADVDVAATLADATSAAAAGGAPCSALFQRRQGYLLVLCYLTPAYAGQVSQLLIAVGSPAHSTSHGSSDVGGQNAALDGATAVLWPPLVWRRLCDAACAAGEPAVAAVALRLLAWAAANDAWARTQLLASPLPAGQGLPPLAAVAAALRGGRGSSRGSDWVVAAAELFEACGCDEAGAAALAGVRCSPLEALVDACRSEGAAAEADEGPQGDGHAQQQEVPAGEQELPESEREALRALRKKRRAVYDARAVGARHAALRALCALCGRRDLVAAEPAAAPLLLELVRVLHEQSPQRSAPVLGPDCQPRAYARRPFAADFTDNPTGDFLLTGLNLGGGLSPGSASGPAAADAAMKGGTPPATQLERALRALLAAARAAGRGGARELHRRDALGLCEALCGYLTPVIVTLAQQLGAALADRCSAAAEEALQGPPALLAGLARWCGSAELHVRALNRLSGLVDGCTGDEFAALTAESGILAWAAGVAGGEADAGAGSSSGGAAQAPAAGAEGNEAATLERRRREAARCLVTVCCERAQRVQKLSAGRRPRGGAWEAVDASALRAITGQGAKPAAAQRPEAPGFDSLRRGFLPPPKRAGGCAGSATKPATVQAAGGQSAAHAGRAGPPLEPARQSYPGGVTIEELSATTEDPTAAGSRSSAPAAAPATSRLGRPAKLSGKGKPLPQTQTPPAVEPEQANGTGSSSESDVEDLTDVFDSTPSESVRRERNAWLATPPAERAKWTQTSTDVMVTVALPPSTRARDVQVAIEAQRLDVTLRWYGHAWSESLHAGVRPAEAQWCLGGGGELQVLLPKAQPGRWWKALEAGGRERSYYELLREAVQAGEPCRVELQDEDEPSPGYEEMGEEGRALLESLLERQAYIAAGLVDPEGFDDFRLVIGENSLRGG